MVALVLSCLDNDIQWEAVAICVITLFLFMLPVILSRRLKLHLPPFFQILMLLFIFASMYLGEIQGFFYKYDMWDIVLHFASSLILCYMGFVLILALNSDKKIHLKLDPFFIALFAFCFALTIGTIWEIFEFIIDELLGQNMQKARELFNPDGTFDSRLGLMDTMKDICVNAIGALIVSIIGYYYCRKKMIQESRFWRVIDEFIKDNPDFFKDNE